MVSGFSLHANVYIEARDRLRYRGCRSHALLQLWKVVQLLNVGAAMSARSYTPCRSGSPRLSNYSPLSSRAISPNALRKSRDDRISNVFGPSGRISFSNWSKTSWVSTILTSQCGRHVNLRGAAGFNTRFSGGRRREAQQPTHI